jgi:NhaP-type Na+/H+ or K+/H+ antiporter
VFLAFLLAFVARPIVVTLVLVPFGYSAREIAAIAWLGLRGAVPVILMTYATSETTIREVLEAVVKDGYIAERPQVIRIERE